MAWFKYWLIFKILAFYENGQFYQGKLVLRLSFMFYKLKKKRSSHQQNVLFDGSIYWSESIDLSLNLD